MRILIIHNTLNDSTSVSGVLRHYAWMANEWIAAGHPTDFLAARAAAPQISQLAPRSRLVCSDRLFNASRYLAQTWRYLPAYAWRMVTPHFTRLPQRYDIVYASGQFIIEVYAAMVLARRLRVPWAIKIHHILASQPQRRGLVDRLFILAEKQSVRWINQRASLVFCGTSLMAGEYRKLAASLRLPERPVAVAGYGIDVQAIASCKSPHKLYDAVFLGRLHQQKGVFELPYVWKEVQALRPGARLLVIGEGPHRQAMTQLFHELHLENSVEITGGISELDKNIRLSQCQLGLSLSYEEGWGLSVTEFLAAGLPVVAYDLPVFHHVFPGQFELVKPGEARAMAQRAAALLENPPHLQTLGKRGQSFVERYDYRQVAREELEILQREASNVKT